MPTAMRVVDCVRVAILFSVCFSVQCQVPFSSRFRIGCRSRSRAKSVRCVSRVRCFGLRTGVGDDSFFLCRDLQGVVFRRTLTFSVTI